MHAQTSMSMRAHTFTLGIILHLILSIQYVRLDFVILRGSLKVCLSSGWLDNPGQSFEGGPRYHNCQLIPSGLVDTKIGLRLENTVCSRGQIKVLNFRRGSRSAYITCYSRVVRVPPGKFLKTGAVRLHLEQILT